MNGYENAPATKLLATNCVCCGRPLVDAISVQLGIGPECRQGYDAGITPEVQKSANEYLFKASMACQSGQIAKVIEYAELIRQLGLEVLADKVARRFRNAKRKADIVITIEDGMYRVDTPFRRGDEEAFIAAWRKIPGRQWRNASNYIPLTQGKALYDLLKQFFAGRFGNGPKGVFRIPTPKPKLEQSELKLVA